MEELIKQLQEKTGLATDQIKSVVDGVMDFIGDKLPGPIGDKVKDLLGADAGDAADAAADEGDSLIDKAKDALGGILGGGND